ncbi:MAG: glycosyltransferase [Bacteroidales bacterium]|nr:glycosyltransferase [Bacteroidales bacterium]
MKNVGKRIAQNGLEKYLEFHEDFEEEGLREFFKKVSVISVPVRKGEAFGIYLLESMASGIPVVQPALGAFPEIVNSSGGGKIYEPNEPSVLSQSLAELLSDSESLDRLALQARKGLEEHFHLNGQVKKMIKIYQSVLNKS